HAAQAEAHAASHGPRTGPTAARATSPPAADAAPPGGQAFRPVAHVGPPGPRPPSTAPRPALPVLAYVRHERGDSESALALLDDACPALTAWVDDGEASLGHLVATGWITLHARGAGEAAAVVAGLREYGGDGGPRHRMHLALLEARVHRAAGRAARAVALFREAATAHVPGEWFAPRAWRLAQLAGVLAERGDAAQALGVLDEARAVRDEEWVTPLAADAVALQHALVEACLGDRTTAARRALDVAERAARAGRTTQALTALHLAARAGSAARAAMLVLSGRAAGSAADAVTARHIRALADHDGDALDHVSEDFASLGLLPLAAEAAGQASRAHREGRDRRRARASQAAGTELSARCDVRPPDWAVPDGQGRPAPVGPRLTSREREVAVLAAAQLSNQEIADRLVVSVRTVENHLYRAYGKLGVTTRAELPQRLGSTAALQAHRIA
ncbi:helix-turn-helix transcriptional regulator, partial [Streptomyces sp. TRM49041]|uniref:helix-turn-helix transcriptional regulator n=1 Tax=Streptomyces sp. TRM49041 TaxID=2603216 RepID=UPI0011ED1A0C